MKVKYILLTCEKYAARQQSQIDTWLAGQDYTYLSEVSGVNKLGIDCESDYVNVAKKFIGYFKNKSNFGLEHDWYYFCDDDAYVYTSRLEQYLGTLPASEKVATGYPYDFCPRTDYQPLVGEGSQVPVHYFGGGAGFALSRSAVIALFDYISSNPCPPYAGFSDVSFGFWMRATGVRLIDSQLFRPQRPCDEHHLEAEIRQHVAYHYVDPELMKQLESFK